MTSRARSGIGAWLCLSATLCLAVIVSSHSDPSELGAPVYWTWALTALQVMALWVAGRGLAWGWMVGSAVQPGWIAYALMTDQLGFVIGCGISTGVQLSAFVRANGAIGRVGVGCATAQPRPKRRRIRPYAHAGLSRSPPDRDSQLEVEHAKCEAPRRGRRGPCPHCRLRTRGHPVSDRHLLTFIASIPAAATATSVASPRDNDCAGT